MAYAVVQRSAAVPAEAGDDDSSDDEAAAYLPSPTQPQPRPRPRALPAGVPALVTEPPGALTALSPPGLLFCHTVPVGPALERSGWL